MTLATIIAKLEIFWIDVRDDIKKSFSYVWKYLHVKILIFAITALNIFTWLFARFISTEIGLDKIALHYSVDFGIDLYGSAAKIYILPTLGAVCAFFNFLLALLISRYVKSDMKFISYVLLLGALLVNVILLGATTSIYLINFR
jgi:hypothetical protein